MARIIIQLIILISLADLSSAQSDSLKYRTFAFETGKEYTIKHKSGFEPTGVIIYQDSVKIKIQTEYTTFDIRKDEIIGVEDFEPAETESPNERVVRDTTDECNIYMVDRTLYKDVRIIRSKDTLITLLRDNVKRKVNLHEINKIEFVGSGLGRGVVIGTAVGFGLGFVTGFALDGFDVGGHHDASFGERLNTGLVIGVVLAIPSAIIGGLIGGLSGDIRKVYDMAGVNREVKLKRLRYIIEENRKGKY